MKTEPKKDHSVKPKPEQEQTVGLTQVGTLHGELPGEFDRDQVIAHLQQENSELKAELLCKETEWAKIFESLKCDLHRHKADLGRCREAMNIALFDTANTGHDSLHGLAECLSLIESPNPQPTQDPTTAIAYGLYPSSARPVNPKTTDRATENWVGYTPIDPQNK